MGKHLLLGRIPISVRSAKKGRIQHNGNKVSPVVITLLQAQETIKAAANVKDKEMYNKTEYLYLIAKKFKMHYHCRKTFLKGFGEKHRQGAKVGEPEVIYIKNNFIRGPLEGLKSANYKKWLKNQPFLNLIVCK